MPLHCYNKTMKNVSEVCKVPVELSSREKLYLEESNLLQDLPR